MALRWQHSSKTTSAVYAKRSACTGTTQNADGTVPPMSPPTIAWPWRVQDTRAIVSRFHLVVAVLQQCRPLQPLQPKCLLHTSHLTPNQPHITLRNSSFLLAADRCNRSNNPQFHARSPIRRAPTVACTAAPPQWLMTAMPMVLIRPAANMYRLRYKKVCKFAEAQTPRIPRGLRTF